MAAHNGSVRTERVQVFARKATARMQGGVQRKRRMALREDEPIPIWIIRPSIRERTVKQGCQNVGDRQCRSDVSYVGALRLL